MDRLSDGAALVAAQIVHDDDVPWRQRGNQHLLHIGGEAPAVDGTIEDARGGNAVTAQGREEGERTPVAVGNLRYQPPAADAAPVGARHIGLGPSLINEDQPGRIKPLLILPPLGATSRDVRPVLFAGVQAFF